MTLSLHLTLFSICLINNTFNSLISRISFAETFEIKILSDLILLEKTGLVKKDTVIFADNVGLFKEDMTEYFKHVRDSSFYNSNNIGSHLEYRENIYDAVEISVRIRD